jgi:predicted ATPase
MVPGECQAAASSGTLRGEVARLGAVLGRTFSYELLRAISPLDEATLHRGLTQLVENELLYQQGFPPPARYLFKQVLIRDVAYQSLLRRTRRQYHQRITATLTERFPETVDTQPELVAHHYTQAGRSSEAIAYWLRAGRRAVESSAYAETIRHLRKGLELLKMVPENRQRRQQELALQTTPPETPVQHQPKSRHAVLRWLPRRAGGCHKHREHGMAAGGGRGGGPGGTLPRRRCKNAV